MDQQRLPAGPGGQPDPRRQGRGPVRAQEGLPDRRGRVRGQLGGLAILGTAALLGLLFIVRERRARQPLLPLRLFRSASLSAGVVLVILLMFALFGAMFFMTFYLENVHGLDPIAAGLHLLPMTAMLIVGSPIAGTLISRIGPRLPIVTGMTMAAAAMFGLSRLGATSSPNDTIIWFVLLGLGLARRAPAPADRSWLRPGQERGLGRGRAGTARHPGEGGQRDHPDQPRHVHRRHHNAFLVGAAAALAGAGIALITKKGTGAAAAHAGI